MPVRDALEPGLTVKDVARRLRVGTEKVRAWIKAGRLDALNTAERGKPRFVIMPEALEDFLYGRRVVSPKPGRRRKPGRYEIDYVARWSDAD